jgi:hypothetical protein
MRSSIIRQGVKWAMENRFTWRELINHRATRLYRRNPPRLNEEQRRILADLNQDGIAITSAAALLGDLTLFANLDAECRRRIAESRSDFTSYTHESNALGAVPKLEFASIFAQFAVVDPILAVINAYFGMFVQLRKYGVFRNVPSNNDLAINQVYHRDGEVDYPIMRMFVYLNDVGAGCGPFTYLPGTHSKSRVGSRLSLESARSSIQPRVATGLTGAIVLADTRGYHQGGRCTSGERWVYQTMYTSPAVGVDYFARSAPATSAGSDARTVALSSPWRPLLY